MQALRAVGRLQPAWRPGRHSASRVLRCPFRDRNATPAPDVEGRTSSVAPQPRREPSSNDPEESRADDDDRVDWRNAWHAVFPVADLPLDRPFPITILGKDLVVWRNSEGWSTFEDLCPHRKVALSEGRLEDDGTLSCAYHGWRFDGDGKCTEIPQLPQANGSTEHTTLSARACTTAFPTREADGLVWVWMDSSPEGKVRAASVPLPLSTGECDRVTTWYVRELCIPWEMVMENLQDYSHVPFSHHGVISNRNVPIVRNLDHIDSFGKDGYVVSESMPAERKLTFSDKLQKVCVKRTWPRMRLDCSRMPSRLDLVTSVQVTDPSTDSELPPDIAFSWIDRVHCVPVTRTRSRFVNRREAVGEDRMLNAVFKPRPTWQMHLRQSTVLDGDGVFLHKQGTGAQTGKLSPADYFMPAASDLAIREFWKFMQKHAPEGVEYYPHRADLEVLPRRVVLDRYQHHTKHCHACSRALANVQLAWRSAVGVGAAALCAGLVLLGRGFDLLSIPVGGAALVCLAAAAAVRQFRNLQTEFIFVDYVHADKT